MNRFIFDIEVFKNFFSATFVNATDESDKRIFVIAPGRNDISQLFEFLNQEMILVGFNNVLFDCPVLHFITEAYLKNPRIKPRELNPDIFRFSSNIIASDHKMLNAEVRSHQKPDNVKYKQIDLMKMMAFDKIGVSLKQISINLLWHKVQDLPLSYDAEVKPTEFQMVLDYNLNDVLITNALYKSLSSQIELREKLSEEYGVDLMSASDSKMADVILEDLYCKEMGVIPKEIRNLRTKRDSVSLKDCIGKNIEFKTNILKRIKREIEEKTVHFEDNFKYGKSVKFANVTYELGVGGLHSEDDPNVFVTDKNFIVRDLDANSYYPNIMIVNNIYPEHLNPKFIDLLKLITKERIEAKKNGNKTKADSLKITVNSIYGKLGSDTFWLYDPKQMLSVTISGQLYLLMMIESLVLAGIEVISANTDGIVSRIPRELEGKYYEVCEWWQKKTGFSLEYTDYSTYIRSDVNNYISVKTDGKSKEKGRYLKTIDLKKAYRHPIIPRVLYNYFVNRIPVMETLRESKSILDFCISQKVGGDFVLEYHKDNQITKLQKNNRFFISTNGGKLIKRRTSNDSEIGLYVGKLATILNDYNKDISIEQYDIDYVFYEDEALKYISEIENNENREDFQFEDEPDGYISPEAIREVERESVIIWTKGIKGFPDRLVDNLVRINKEFMGDDFLDFLVYCEENSLLSSKFRELIKINYFSKFGGAKKLLYCFEEFDKGKNKYSKTLSEKSKVKRLDALRFIFAFAGEEEFTIREQICNELQVMNSIKTHFNVDKRYAYVLSVQDQYTPKIELQGLRTGLKQTVKISRKIFDRYPVYQGDIVLRKELQKKNSMKKNEFGEWETVAGKSEWWLGIYYVTKQGEEFLTE